VTVAPGEPKAEVAVTEVLPEVRGTIVNVEAEGKGEPAPMLEDDEEGRGEPAPMLEDEEEE
jgi:hypothetical protein